MSQDLIGHKLGDYVIERQIAIGGMATIYLGVDAKLGRNAAIKVLLPDVAGRDDTLTTRFEREARAIAQLEHDNIIPIYQFGQQDNLYFLAMRFVEGDDLSNILTTYNNDGKLIPFDRALKILDQVAAALDYAHTTGIVHRDVKPSNVLIAANDRVYLSDFGLVLYSTGDQTLGTAFGTPRYISPEQATDSTLATGKSDIYSLAVIVYEIVTGQRLFKGKTPMEIALSHITEAPPPPRVINPNISPEMQLVILRSLEKDPEARHPTARAFIDELRLAHERTMLKDYSSNDPTEPDAAEVFDTRQLLAASETDAPSVPAPAPVQTPKITQTVSPYDTVITPAVVPSPISTQPLQPISQTQVLPVQKADVSLVRKKTDRTLLGLIGGLIALIGAVVLFIAITSLNQVPLTPTDDASLIGLTASVSSEGVAVISTVPTSTPSEEATAEPTSEVIAPAVFTATDEPTETRTPRPSATQRVTVTNTTTEESTSESTELGVEVKETEEITIEPTEEMTEEATVALRPSNTPRVTRTPEPTDTPTPTVTRTPRPTTAPTNTPTATRTPSNTPTDTKTPTNTATATKTTTPTKTPTPTATEPPTIVSVPLRGDITLRYNNDLFAIINAAEVAQDVTLLQFNGATEGDTFVNSSAALGDSLTGQSCVLIILSGRNVPVPPEWGCAGVRSVNINPPAVFWRAEDANDQTFTFELAQTIVTCDTFGRAVGRLDEGVCEVR